MKTLELKKLQYIQGKLFISRYSPASWIKEIGHNIQNKLKFSGKNKVNKDS